MNWVRSNIRLGSRSALFALAIQFVLSFGHFHPLPTPAIQSAAAQANIAAASLDATAHANQKQQPASDHDSDQSSDDGCAICAVMALASTALFSAPPVLPVPHAIDFSYRIAQPEFAELGSDRVAFQPRGPPLS